MSQVVVDLVAQDGAFVASLLIVAKSDYWNGIPTLVIGQHSASSAAVQLLEEEEYFYELEGVSSLITFEPSEIFDANRNRLGGRLRPGRHTGLVVVELKLDDGVVGRAELEVRSRKLDYESEYQWMLEGLATAGAELVMHRFAASRVRSSVDVSSDASTIYQRFELLKSILESDELQASLAIIAHRPHREFQTITRLVSPTAGIRPDRHLAELLTRAGPRVELGGPAVGGLMTVPAKIAQRDHVETADTVPNRFVRFALDEWRWLCHNIAEVLSTRPDAAARRGYREAEQLEDALGQALRTPVLAEAGRLIQFPVDNQVLQKREGYREVFQAFLFAEAAASLDWPAADQIYGAGQRNVAELYEYWVFLEVARIVGALLDQDFDLADLVTVSEDSLTLELRRGKTLSLSGKTNRFGRKLEVELWFNRPMGSETWSGLDLRPDVSLRIAPRPHLGSDGPTWLHFDAKYRIDGYLEVFNRTDGTQTESEASQLRAKTDDIAKMHAYRDAIRRSSGAYVLYPGDGNKGERSFRYHEILPGVGAFSLRPTTGGHADSKGQYELSQFISDVLDHVAAQGTSQERADFWSQASYDGRTVPVQIDSLDWTTKPAADMVVLLGYCHGEEHLSWIEAQQIYNLRADPERDGAVGLESAELGADIVVLYNPEWSAPRSYRTDGTLRLRSGADLLRSGYVDPRGDSYVCLGLARDPVPLEITIDSILALTRLAGRRSAAPIVISLETLIKQES